ncbi:Para-aminobenzoate synthase, aminase component [hydrothermal vent metagenome]|uniref:Para-aminobenzoate synthase, aminase component n=1 Tax=hydrothermal vent metagenome TaxID=652676 RepID=A0A3B0WE99_9ZZZZ
MSDLLIIHKLKDIPDLLALHSSNPERYPHLLKSNASTINIETLHNDVNNHINSRANSLSRYDILFACPQQTLLGDNNDFLALLDSAWIKEKQAHEGNADEKQNIELPFTGGWFLYLSYELAQQIEPRLNLPKAEDGLPVAFATRFPSAIIIDSKKQQAFLICEAQYSQYASLIQEDLIQYSRISYQQTFEIKDIQEDDEQRYLAELKKLHQYIIEGDVFQVNLSRCWKTELIHPVSHASLFHQLSQSNPGPFNALVTLGDKAIISSSPERLIRLKKGWLETRPIAGTRPRSSDYTVDHSLSKELLAHPKERAEHVMLIDLARNDLGRICKAGSINVNELMVLESYRHVHHIVSNIVGELRDDITPGQLIAAVFPGGTITGCPKVRCMEILAELEQVGRGAYTGALGYLNHDGSMDLNILIRTITRNGDLLQFRAGGGIVIDSDPQNELKETRSKAKGLIHALQAGNR